MKIAIAGISGRMGLTLVRAIAATKGFELVAGSERPGFNITEVQTQLAADGFANLTIVDNPEALIARADAVIDFTTPEATLELAEAIAKKSGIHIIGTTGLTPSQMDHLKSCAKKARIVQSGNFSLGVNLLECLVEQTAKILDESYDIEIYEMHHKHKKDSPSGTALMLGRAAAAGRNTTLDKKQMLDRNGVRKPGDIGFAISRGGDVVGIHSVTFAGPAETIELKHQGFSREIYAQGALKAAAWASKQKPGLYSMKDVVGL